MIDPLSAFVGAMLCLIVSFGLGWVWFYLGASPRERAARRLAKWEAKHGKRRGLNAVKQ